MKVDESDLGYVWLGLLPTEFVWNPTQAKLTLPMARYVPQLGYEVDSPIVLEPSLSYHPPVKAKDQTRWFRIDVKDWPDDLKGSSATRK